MIFADQICNIQIFAVRILFIFIFADQICHIFIFADQVCHISLLLENFLTAFSSVAFVLTEVARKMCNIVRIQSDTVFIFCVFVVVVGLWPALIQNAVIVFSYIGMRPYEVTVGAQTEINVAMETDNVAMDEVVVVGYGVCVAVVFR